MADHFITIRIPDPDEKPKLGLPIESGYTWAVLDSAGRIVRSGPGLHRSE